MKALRKRMALLCSVCAVSSAVSAQDRVGAIAEVKEILPLVCGDFQQEGNSTRVAIKGDAQAKIDGLLKKLVGLGISGAGEFNSEQYVGVLQAEVGQQLNSVRECRLKVFGDMKELINGKPAGTIIDGDKNAVVNGNGNKVEIK